MVSAVQEIPWVSEYDYFVSQLKQDPKVAEEASKRFRTPRNTTGYLANILSQSLSIHKW